MSPRKLAVWVALTLLAGCAGSVRGMKTVSNPVYHSGEGQATVVFARHTHFGAAISFMVVDEQKHFVAGLRGKTHAIAQVTPGPHRFYVLAESTEPIHATLEAGRTYVIETRVRSGWWVARATAEAVRRGTPRFAEAPGWISSSSPLAPEGSDGQLWVDGHAANIDAKISTVEGIWAAKDPEWQAAHTLAPDDGYLPNELR